MFKLVIELFIGAMIILGLITQVLYPMFSSRELFWLFRSKKSGIIEVEKEIAAIDEYIGNLRKDKEEKAEALKKNEKIVDSTIEDLQKIKKRSI